MRAQVVIDLTGAAMTHTWLFGSSTDFALNPSVDGVVTSFTVGSGTEVTGTFFNQGNININGSNLLVTMTNNGGGFSGNAFNGSQFTLDPAFGVITGAAITSGGLTNMVGFDSSRITVTNGSLFLNFQGLPFDTSTRVEVTVFGAVPEPSQLTLLGVGLAALTLGVFVKSRRRTSAL